MGLLALSDFQDELDVTFGDRSLSSDTTRRWTNFGYLELSGGVDFEILDEDFVFASAIGTRNYTGPVDPLVVKILRNTTRDETLTWVPKEEFFRLPSTETGHPRRWTRHKDEILVWPTPTAVQSLLAIYKDEPSALANASDVTVLPATWDLAVIYFAKAHGYMTLGEEQRGSFWYNKAIAYVNSRMTEGNLQFNPGLNPSFKAGGSGGVPDPAALPG